jgi:hypothetical protein
MQIKLNTRPKDLDLISEQLYKGALADIAKATGYSLEYVNNVMQGKRNNHIIISAARMLIKEHQEALNKVELIYRDARANKKNLKQTA